jgi:arylformamidase
MRTLRALTCLTLLLALPVAALAPRERLRDGLLAREERAQALPAGTQVLRDIAYGAHPRQRLDVYRAPAAGDDAQPVIVMVHGGGWRFGDKASPGVVGAKATRWLPRGFVLVSVNYRMLPDHDVRTQGDDVASAVTFVQREAARWGGDPRRVLLMGHSAGAHLVALVSADPARWAGAGLRPWLGTVALDGAALDVEAVMGKRHLRLLDDAFGRDPAFWRATSPAATLRAGGVPLLAVCSRLRRDDSCAQSRSYAARAAALGVRAEVLAEPLTHAQVNRELGVESAYTLAVERFLASLDADVARRLGRSARR